ncbi:MAG TPA: DUF3536 domain-containing protein [Anaerolineae bacterium]|nr:DUF3536 domain-containing protein [Anaerolineae bacterium]HQH38518.1 DUF3536 domain-containing protein [Anaerolineae bacterium]
MTSAKPLLCVHGHFYQPPREDPFTGKYRYEPSAAPFPNWNARIAAECYAPNAATGNFGRISFNLGGTLARWMSENVRDAYQRIVDDVARYAYQYGVGNGIAQAVHHTILPLARGRDKRCQIRWGIASYVHRFGMLPEGIWLPEMAVDYETLEAVAETGLAFVILSAEQVRGDLSCGAGPYRVRLPHGRTMNVFIRERSASDCLSFSMPSVEAVRPWANALMAGRPHDSLTLIATDGETFGHHHKHGVRVLEALTTPGDTDAYEMTTLARYMHQHPPHVDVEIVENTAWSCTHRLGRWATGCQCTLGYGQQWKSALRRALDNLSRDIDEIYAEATRRWNLAPWSLRDEYIRVVLQQVSGPAFLSEYYLGHLSTVAQQRLLDLLEAQVHRQRMFVSCAFFFEDLERIESRYAIASAVQAMALVSHATGDDLTRAFRRDLSIAVSPGTGRTGAQILDEIMAGANFADSPLGNGRGVGIDQPQAMMVVV